MSLDIAGLLSRWLGRPALLQGLARPAAEPSPLVPASSHLVREDPSAPT